MNTLDEFADIGLCPQCGAYWACECGAWRPGSGELTEADIALIQAKYIPEVWSKAAAQGLADGYASGKAMRDDWLRLMERAPTDA